VTNKIKDFPQSVHCSKSAISTVNHK